MNTLPMVPVGTLDDLLERARRGATAGTALDYIKDKLTFLRDDAYRKLLNAPPERANELRHELKAIEKIAQAILVEQAQGEIAYNKLMENVGSNEPVKEQILKPTRVARKRRLSAKDKTAK